MKDMKEKMGREIILICMVIAIFVAGLFYGQIQYEKGYQVGIQEGVRFGFNEGSLNPAREIENQIHNQGFERGFNSGLGQPQEEFLPEAYIILMNLSQDEVYKAQGINRTSLYVYQIISYHFKSPVDGSYNESLGAGWSAPEFVMIKKEENR